MISLHFMILSSQQIWSVELPRARRAPVSLCWPSQPTRQTGFRLFSRRSGIFFGDEAGDQTILIESCTRLNFSITHFNALCYEPFRLHLHLRLHYGASERTDGTRNGAVHGGPSRIYGELRVRGNTKIESFTLRQKLSSPRAFQKWFYAR